MTKLGAELMLQKYAAAYELPYVINRCGLLTGPWQMAKSDQGVIALWVAAHYFRRPLAYIGFGGVRENRYAIFLYIQDFCELVMHQIRNFAVYSGNTWNVGGGIQCSLSLMEATALC